MAITREQELTNWVNAELDHLLKNRITEKADIQLEIVSGDASFRRYFRARLAGQSFIAVDAPPANEDSKTFVRVAELFREADVLTPSPFSVDYDNGFMLLEDFGDELYLPRLIELQNADAQVGMGQLEIDQLYQSAIDSLLKIQSNVDKKRLGTFSQEKLRTELRLFEHWFCEEFLLLKLNDQDRMLLNNTFTFLENEILSQTQLAVHKDYHSRNLLILDKQQYGPDSGPGIIDFQDAVAGAYTYDLVSLLRDCYIKWQPRQVQNWAIYYLNAAKKQGLIGDISQPQFMRDVGIMGLQRHLKVMGIFARLSIRDNKPQYLADIPLVIQYFLEVARTLEEMAPFLSWLENTVLPVAKTKLELDL